MTVRHRLLAYLLLPLLAAGVGGLRWGHVAIAHGDGEAATETACSHRHHACGHAHGPVTPIEADEVREEGSRSEAPSPSDDGCLDCDLLAVMVGGATLDVPASLIATPTPDRAVDRGDVDAIATSDAHRARPPPVV